MGDGRIVDVSSNFFLHLDVEVFFVVALKKNALPRPHGQSILSKAHGTSKSLRHNL